jgi:ATP-dependent RNA helicase RhlE
MKEGYIATNNGEEISKPFLLGVKHKLFYASKQRKMELLAFVLRKRIKGKVIVFRRTTFGAEKVLKSLLKLGHKAVCLHSEKSREEQKNAMDQFNSFDVGFLVLTDVKLKSLNLERVGVIINFDLPTIPEAYLDRQLLMLSKGISFVFCSIEEKKTVRVIEEIIDKRLVVEKNHPFNDDPEEFIAGVRRPDNTSRKSRKSDASKKKKKRWY